MPLNKPALKNALVGVASAPPGTLAACAQKWAEAVGLYFTAVVPPSAAVAAAQATLQVALTSAFAGTDAATLAAKLETAFAACAITIGGGMAGFGPVAPAGQVGFAQLFAPPFAATHDAAADKIANAIHAWAITHVSPLLVPPFTPTAWT